MERRWQRRYYQDAAKVESARAIEKEREMGGREEGGGREREKEERQ